MKRLLTTLVILTGFIGSAGAVWVDAKSDLYKGLRLTNSPNHLLHPPMQHVQLIPSSIRIAYTSSAPASYLVGDIKRTLDGT
jgi:hypothetical protein